MRKLPFKNRRWFERRESRKRAAERRRAITIRKKRRLSRMNAQVARAKEKTRRKRDKIFYEIHKPLKYDKDPKPLVVVGEMGLEEEANRDKFLDFAEEVIEFDARELLLNLNEAVRIWPSTVTLLCSMKQWLEIGARIGTSDHPSIRSTEPDLSYVAAYLDHCGFHDYVGRARAEWH